MGGVTHNLKKENIQSDFNILFLQYLPVVLAPARCLGHPGRAGLGSGSGGSGGGAGGGGIVVFIVTAGRLAAHSRPAYVAINQSINKLNNESVEDRLSDQRRPSQYVK